MHSCFPRHLPALFANFFCNVYLSLADVFLLTADGADITGAGAECRREFDDGAHLTSARAIIDDFNNWLRKSESDRPVRTSRPAATPFLDRSVRDHDDNATAVRWKVGRRRGRLPRWPRRRRSARRAGTMINFQISLNKQ